MLEEYRPEGTLVSIPTVRNLHIETRWFGALRTLRKVVETCKRPVYIVLGLFPRGHEQPSERIVFVAKPHQLFHRMRAAVFHLRGWRGAFLSLRHVKEFRLYRCDIFNGSHDRVTDLDANGRGDLQMFC